MTVSQLIAMLKSQPGEAEVYYDYDEANRWEITGMFRTRDERVGEVVVLQSRL
jgi:hypothetical protein